MLYLVDAVHVPARCRPPPAARPCGAAICRAGEARCHRRAALARRARDKADDAALVCLTANVTVWESGARRPALPDLPPDIPIAPPIPLANIYTAHRSASARSPQSAPRATRPRTAADRFTVPFSGFRWAAGDYCLCVEECVRRAPRLHSLLRIHATGNGKLATWGCIIGFVVMMCLDVGLG
ncbi:hypothetical protein RR46_09227 [Papilio xuthus]|uniref:Uncharacterized protein n=1 Tax=Papilio xuthus TaxID=66420 RepID=A0A194Q1P3_PAPXU|nr:hypothetical protein RR46_09227 [Papilio xuthus]